MYSTMNLNGLKGFLLFSIIITANSCPQPCIYVSNTTNILAVQASLTNQQPTSILSNLNRAVALDVHVTRSLIFWSDVLDKSIKRANIDGSNIMTIVKDGIGVCDGLAVEWSTDLLYWTDTTFNKIEVAHLDGSKRKVLISANLDEPRGIAVDPQAGLMFWTDWGKTPKIESAYLNGKNRKTVLTASLGWPNDIVLDQSQQKIYWVDAQVDKIEYADYSGFNRQPLLHHPGIHPFGVSIVSSWLYWTDWNTQFGLHKMDKSTGSLINKLHISGRRMGLTIFDSSRQPSTSNGCQNNNGGCEFLCLLKHNGHVCACPYGMVLRPDGKTCKIPAYGCQQPCLYLSNTTHIIAVQASLKYRPLSVISNLSRAVALDVHVSRHMIVWSDVNDTSIKRASVDGSNIMTIVKDGIGVCDGLAVEWSTDLLYWTDATFNKIEVTHLDGSKRKVLISANLDEPRGIALDPQAGFMFWTDWGSSPKIERAYLNGENRQTIVSSSLGWPNDITVDHSTHVIYWVDAKTDMIESADFSGTNRKQLFFHSGIHPFGVAILGPWLYWTDWATVSGLHQMNRTSGGLQTKQKIPGRRMGLAVFDSSRQSSVSNGCQTNNGGCSFLCLLKPNGYVCVCSNDTILGNDGKTCSVPAKNCSMFVPKPNTVAVTPCEGLAGSQCSLKCTTGYSLSNGSTIVTCLKNGVWSGDGPSCSDSQPPVFTSCPGNIIKYAGIDKTSLVKWTLPSATDNSGLPPVIAALSGSNPPLRLGEGVRHVTYTATDKATNKAICSFTITVIVIRCTALIPNGVLQKNGCANHYGGTCSFICPKGYRLVGNATLNCLSTNGGPPGVWDSPLPKCEAIICPVLSTPKNAVKSNCNGQINEAVGTVCQFSCVLGYQPSTVQTRTCLDNGTWSGKPLVCYSVSCHPLVRPKFGSIAPSTCLNGGKYTDVCQFSCPNGFRINGTTTRTCSSDGQWTGFNNTYCEDVSPPAFSNTCPNDKVYHLGPCSTNITVHWNRPIVTDNSGNVKVLEPSLQPPVLLSNGIYTINYTAIDPTGNRRSCVFKIQVIRKYCRNLSPPTNGLVESMSCKNYYGSVAFIGCKVGYFVNGPNNRTCTFTGQWSGVTTTCSRVTCTPLPPLKFGTLEPKTCTTGLPVVSGTYCVFKCNLTNGFQNDGVSQATCTEKGAWSAGVSKTSCKDIQPPNIQCPQGISVNTDPGEAFATVSWAVPVPHDNSGENIKLTVTKRIRPPHRFSVGHTSVRYSAQDSAGLKRSCLFTVTVLDHEPPKKVKCLKKKEVKSDKQDIKVFFPRAVFTDNVGVTSIVTNRKNGSKFTWGIHNVTYTAHDKAGNQAICTLKVFVIAKTACKRPSPPRNGAIACDNMLAGMSCSVHCNPDYVFAVAPQNPLICDAQYGKWLKSGKSKPVIPACSEKERSDVEIEGDLYYLVETCNEENSNEVKQKFIATMKSFFDTIGSGMSDYCSLGGCKLENIFVKCGKKDDGRRKRSTDNKQRLEIYFKIKIPFPKNASSNINATVEKVQSSVFQSINKNASSLEVNGVTLTLEKPPMLRFVSLSCETGHVLSGSSCAACPPGYYYKSSSKSCSPCPVNQFQEDEAQTLCSACPSGTSTLGSTGSKTCSKVDKSTDGDNTLSRVVIPVVASVAVLVVLAVVALFVVKRYRQPRPRGNRADSDMHHVIRYGPSNHIENPTYDDIVPDDHIYETVGDKQNDYRMMDLKFKMNPEESPAEYITGSEMNPNDSSKQNIGYLTDSVA